MATTRFWGFDSTSPATGYEAVTPGDTSASNHTNLARALYVGGAGNVAFVDVDGTAVTFTGLLAGQVYPITSIRINSTGTTATNLVALF